MVPPNWFRRSSPFARLFKPIGRIEFIVAEELPDVAMQAVGAGLDGGVEHRTGGTAQLGAELAGLHLELLDGVHRRQDDVVGAVEEVDGVGVVVNAVQQVVVLRGAQAVGGKRARSGVAAGVGLGRLRAGAELGKEGKVASVQRRQTLTVCSLTTWPTDASSVCSSGGAVVTSTVSVAAPSLS